MHRIFLKTGQPRRLLPFIFSLFKQTSLQFYTKICEKMSIQFTVPGFKPTTSGSWVSPHNHWIRAPPSAQRFILCQRINFCGKRRLEDVYDVSIQCAFFILDRCLGRDDIMMKAAQSDVLFTHNSVAQRTKWCFHYSRYYLQEVVGGLLVVWPYSAKFCHYGKMS